MRAHRRKLKQCKCSPFMCLRGATWLGIWGVYGMCPNPGCQSSSLGLSIATLSLLWNILIIPAFVSTIDASNRDICLSPLLVLKLSFDLIFSEFWLLPLPQQFSSFRKRAGLVYTQAINQRTPLCPWNKMIHYSPSTEVLRLQRLRLHSF